MSPTVGYGRERTEAQFELRLSVTGPATIDVSVRAGVVRVRRVEDGKILQRRVK